jgi:hypothetical protein
MTLTWWGRALKKEALKGNGLPVDFKEWRAKAKGVLEA